MYMKDFANIDSIGDCQWLKSDLLIVLGESAVWGLNNDHQQIFRIIDNQVRSVSRLDESYIVTSQAGEIAIWDTSQIPFNKSYSFSLSNKHGSPRCLAANSYVIDLNIAGQADNIIIRDTIDLKPRCTFYHAYLHGGDCYRDELKLVTYSRNGTIREWSIKDEKMVNEYKLDNVDLINIAYDLTGQYVAVADYIQGVHIVEASTGKLVKLLTHTCSKFGMYPRLPISEAVFTPNHQKLISVGPAGIWIWNTSTWNLEAYIENDGEVRHVAVEPQNKVFTTIDNRSNVWTQSYL